MSTVRALSELLPALTEVLAVSVGSALPSSLSLVTD